MLEAELVLSRLLHYLAVLALFAIALFPFYARYGGERKQSRRGFDCIGSWPVAPLQ